MFTAFYDPREHRDSDLRGRFAMECDLALQERHSAPRTAEHLLFILDTAEIIDGDRPAPIVN